MDGSVSTWLASDYNKESIQLCVKKTDQRRPLALFSRAMTMTMNKGQRPTNTPTSDVVTNGGRTER